MSRRQHATLSFMLALNALIASSCWALPAHGQDWPPGSVLCSVNLDESQNTSPGKINHLGTYVGQGWIVESQEGLGVIYTRLSDYLARPYQVGILFPIDRELGRRAALTAHGQVGRPYRKLASLAPLLVPPIVPTLIHGRPDGMSCVSQVRECYEAGLGRPLIGFRIPDDITLRPDLFTNQL
jgi:hypothetical protein